jgi:anti-sigma-K factor RskA
VTDERHHTPIDLSAISLFPDPTREDRVVGRAMARIRASRPAVERRHLLGDIAALWRPALAAASVIATVAGIAISTTGVPQGDAPAEQLRSRLLEWAESGHVPSNGELIATFGGTER